MRSFFDILFVFPYPPVCSGWAAGCSDFLGFFYTIVELLLMINIPVIRPSKNVSA